MEWPFQFHGHYKYNLHAYTVSEQHAKVIELLASKSMKTAIPLLRPRK